MMYNMTSKGQFENLTSGQGHQGHEMSEIGHVAYQSMRMDETYTSVRV